MAKYLVRNSLNPSSIATFGITTKKLVPKGNDGDPIWVLEIITDALDTNGDSILPAYVNLVGYTTTASGGQTEFELTWEASTKEDVGGVYVNSVSQHPDTYTVLSNTVTLDTPTALNDTVHVAFTDLDDAIAQTTSDIADQIDWGSLATDRSPPYAVEWYPEPDNARITEDVIVYLSDSLPSTGIDSSTIEMSVNGFDVTGNLDITGDAYLYRVSWSPPIRIYDTYL